MRITFLIALIAAAATALLFTQFSPSASLEPTANAVPESTPADRPLEFVVLDPARMICVRIETTVDGKAVSAVWDGVFARLVTLYDRDGDAKLDRAEAARLPSAFSLRQLLWGRSVPHTGQPIPWEELAPQNTPRIGPTELARYYRSAGVGDVSVAYGIAPSSSALSTVITKTLDSNADGTISNDEWKTAPERLRRLDRNGDELITAPELVLHADYPGRSGVRLLLPNTEAWHQAANTDCPILVLPTGLSDTEWADSIVRCRDRNNDNQLNADEAGLKAEVFARLDTDHDKQLSPAELARRRSLPPDIHWRIEIGSWPAGEPKLAIAPGQRSLREEAIAGSTRLIVRGDQGQLPRAMTSARLRLTNLFTEANRDGSVGINDVGQRNFYELQQLLTIADKDTNGQLSKAELEAWVDMQESVAKAHVLVQILDHGRGLFEWIDADHDGGLSIAELRSSAERHRLNVGSDGKSVFPRHLFASVSRGNPREALCKPAHIGPDWFRAMDRNGDGVVSRTEFVGSPEKFDRLDRDRNGLLTANEAEETANNKK